MQIEIRQKMPASLTASHPFMQEFMLDTELSVGVPLGFNEEANHITLQILVVFIMKIANFQFSCLIHR